MSAWKNSRDLESNDLAGRFVRCSRFAGQLKMTGDRIDSRHLKAEALSQPNRMVAFTTPDVQDVRTAGQPELRDDVLHQLRRGRVQALVQRRLERFFDARVFAGRTRPVMTSAKG